jgi:HEAT repeats
MNRAILAVVLLLIILAVGGEIAYVGWNRWQEYKQWHGSEGKDRSVDINYKGRSLHDWIADLKAGDVQVRRNAAEALLEVPFQDGKYAITALKDAMDDKDNLTRARAAAALGRILPRAGIPASPEVILPNAKIMEIAEILKDPDPTVRAATAQAMGNFGHRARPSGPALAELAKNDPDESVRNAAATALKTVDPSLQPATKTTGPAHPDSKKS